MINQNFRDAGLPPKKRAELLLGQLTLREKVGQLCQRLYGFEAYDRCGEKLSPSQSFLDEVKRFGGLGTLYGLYRADPWSKRDFATGLAGALAPKAYNMLQRVVMERSRFGIPMLLSSESPHGHQALGGYLLPVNLAAAATFDPELFERAQNVCGRQLRQMGVNLALVSALDVLRDPRWGRSEECFGEDPYLAAQFAAAAVRGIQSAGIGMVAKHFCAQGETTGGVNASAARIGERELREIHLPPAKACCKEHVAGIMAAYNEIDGMFCHANQWLLTELLRNEFQFSGVVMADGCAIDQLAVITGDTLHAAAAALNAGVDIGLWDEAFAQLEQAVDQGLIHEEAIDRAVLRVLTLKFEQGLFEHPYLPENADGRSFTAINYSESLQLARESAVLLKNEGELLPLVDCGKKMPRKIAIIGPAADDLYRQLGDYTPPVAEGEAVTVLQGMCTLVGEEAEVLFSPGCSGEETQSAVLLQRAQQLASTCDVVILVLGGSSSRFGGATFDSNGAAIISGEEPTEMDCGEGVDNASLRLPANQVKLFGAVRNCCKKLVTVLTAGRPYAIEEIAQQTDSLLYCFYPGPQGGRAIAEIICGTVSPSGRLPVSIPRSANQLPIYYNAKNSYRPMKYCDIPDSPLFSFGEGFGYGTLEFSGFSLSAEQIALTQLQQDGIEVTFRIDNNGALEETAVPQLYVQIFRSSTVRRIRELKAFRRVTVPAGEHRDVCLSLSAEAFAVWNTQMQLATEPCEANLLLMDSGNLIGSRRITIES